MLIVAATPAANNNLAASDYGNVGSTALATVANAAFSTSAYNDITLPTTAVTKAGITKLGSRLNWDTSGTFGGTWAVGVATSFTIYHADEAGTTKDPKLVVVHAAPAGVSFLSNMRSVLI